MAYTIEGRAAEAGALPGRQDAIRCWSWRMADRPAHITNNYRIGYGDGSQNWAGEGWAVLYPNPRGSSELRREVHAGELQRLGRRRLPRHHDRRRRDDRRGHRRSRQARVSRVELRRLHDRWVVSQTTRFKAAMQGAGMPDMPSMYGTNDIPNVMISAPFSAASRTKDTLPLYTARSGITYRRSRDDAAA